jgi:hypothetical protein
VESLEETLGRLLRPLKRGPKTSLKLGMGDRPLDPRPAFS